MKKTLFTLASVAMVAGIASGCSSASSGGGSTLAPSQVDTDGPMKAPPPDGPSAGKAPPPPQQQDFEGCPSTRDPAETVLTGADDVRAKLVGIYRTCLGVGTGLEIRLDPDSDLRLLWWALDDRFVRLQGGLAASGAMVIGECDGAACLITWHTSGMADDPDPERELTVWSDPTAITVAANRAGSWSEWVRVAN
jgi:hypothetical protein